MRHRMTWLLVMLGCFLWRPSIATAAEAKDSSPSETAGTAISSAAADGYPRIYTHWESFHVEDGLPANKIYCIAVDRDRVWAGTDNGLALYENGKWSSFGVKDGLSYPGVLALAIDPATRDVWAATMKGLTHISNGKFEVFTQLNSGLPNDVVFGVCIENQNIWVATTAGTARFRVAEKVWDVFTPANSPQHEPWGYHVTYNDGKLYAALWGGGILEFDIATQGWKSWRDPDGEMEVDVMRDDGLIHVITTSSSYIDKVLWVSTYFGMSRYDGRHWRGYTNVDSGIPSNFINLVKANHNVAWVCTDQGLGTVNGDNNKWVSYVPVDPVWENQRGAEGATNIEGTKGYEARVYDDDKKLIKKVPLDHPLANNHIYGVDFQGDDVWVATSKGVSHGMWKGGI